MKLEYIKNESDAYISLRQVLKTQFRLSSRLILKLKKNNSILLNNDITYLDKKLSNNDIITVSLDFDEDNSNIIATNIPLDILYEDDCYLIINKPAGIPVHPSLEHYTDSLSNGVKYYFNQIGLNKKIRPVNRLDKNTSGLIVFAKNEYIQECLIQEMNSKNFKKEYIAFCSGIFDNKSGTITAPIARKESSIIERCVSEDGDSAITHYKILAEKNDYSELLVNIETGRTHQIRVHMAYIKHPILGDTLYGFPSYLIDRQALHAYTISFIHPIKKELVTYKAPLPQDIKNLI